MRYAPNAAEIEALIERVKTLTPEQIEFWHEQWPTDMRKILNAAHDKVRDAGWDITREEMWYKAWPDALKALEDAAPTEVRNVIKDKMWGVMWSAIYHAILALVLKDIISQQIFDVLYGPWRSVMESENE